MPKQISIIFASLALVALVSGCGVKRGLYQTPEKTPVEASESDANNSKEQSLHQQEKHQQEQQ